MINGVAFMVTCSRARSQARSHILAAERREVVEVGGRVVQVTRSCLVS